MNTKHEFCVTYAKIVDGEQVEVHHGHCDAGSPEEAAVLVALDGAQEGVDVSQCDALIKVVMTPPPALVTMIKFVMETGAKVVHAATAAPHDTGTPNLH